MEYLPDGLAPYRDYLKHKKIYCCCDNPEQSSFVRYFAEHFHELDKTTDMLTDDTVRS
jgi:hypothetical protein